MVDFSLETDVLDNLPFGVSVQDLRFKIQYQNHFLREFFGGIDVDFCYERWEDYDDFGDEMCKDCPTQATTLDGKSHTVLRKATNSETGEITYFKILHQPLLNTDGSFDRYIEIVEEVSGVELDRLLSLENMDQLAQEMYFIISLYGDLGGQTMAYDVADHFAVDSTIEEFLLKLAQFWFIAIGQGDNWPIGLFGPLPVFDHIEYDSYAYSFRVPNKALQDPRFEGKDACIMLLIVRKENEDISHLRVQVADLLEHYVQSLEDADDLLETDFDQLRTQINQLSNY